MKVHPMILIDVLALSTVLCVLSAIALALLPPSDEAFLPALIGLIVSASMVVISAVGLHRALKH